MGKDNQQTSMARRHGCLNYLIEFKAAIIKMLQQAMTNSLKTKRKIEKSQKNRKYKEAPNGNFSTKNIITEIKNYGWAQQLNGDDGRKGLLM